MNFKTHISFSVARLIVFVFCLGIDIQQLRGQSYQEMMLHMEIGTQSFDANDNWKEIINHQGPISYSNVSGGYVDIFNDGKFIPKTAQPFSLDSLRMVSDLRSLHIDLPEEAVLDLSGFKQLEILFIDQLEFRKRPVQVIFPPNVKVLELHSEAGNGFADLSQAIIRCPKLQALILSIPIQELSFDPRACDHVEYMKITRSDLTSLPGNLHQMPNLEELVLSDNLCLRILPKDLFPQSLSTLILGGNAEVNIGPHIWGLQHLSVLFFLPTDAKKISKAQLTSETLYDLLIEGENLEEIKDLSGLPALGQLRIRAPKMKTLPKGLTSLRELGSFTVETAIPFDVSFWKTIAQIPTLEFLYLFSDKPNDILEVEGKPCHVKHLEVAFPLSNQAATFNAIGKMPDLEDVHFREKAHVTNLSPEILQSKTLQEVVAWDIVDFPDEIGDWKSIRGLIFAKTDRNAERLKRIFKNRPEVWYDLVD